MNLKDTILQATARGWCDPKNSHKEVDADLASSITAEVEKAVDEYYALKFAAIMTASIQNTPEAIKDRIDRDNPYWTVAYADVCRAVDREMALLAKQRAEALPSVPLTEILRSADHIEKNGISLAKFGGSSIEEGRCRELCAMYLRELVSNYHMGKRLEALQLPGPESKE